MFIPSYTVLEQVRFCLSLRRRLLQVVCKKEKGVVRLVLIRMFGFFVGAIISEQARRSPANNRKTKTGDQWSPLQTNFGRELVFSADL